MKPHFGQSDAVMNKLAGYTKAEHEEAAGMSLDDMFMSQHDQPCDCAVCDDIAFRRSLNISGVDAAVARHDEELLVLKAQLITERLLGDKLICDRDAALSKAEFWRVSHDAACEDAKNWRRDAQDLQGQLNFLDKHCQKLVRHISALVTALESIATYHSDKDHMWSTDMKQIAKEALGKVKG